MGLRILSIFVALMSAFFFLLEGKASYSASLPSGEDNKVVYYRNRFGRLASHVWRYRQPFVPRDLKPVKNNNPYPEPQPKRDRPEKLALNADGTKLYITLAGSEAEPGNEIAVFDIKEGKVMKRITVGLKPYNAILHPRGRFLVVINELSNYATVVDTFKDKAIGKIPLDYYSQGLVFSRDGQKAWVANRYLNQIFVLNVQEKEESLAAQIKVLGGFDEQVFYGKQILPDSLKYEIEARKLPEKDIQGAMEKGVGGINSILRARCGKCHNQSAGGFISGPDPVENFLSAIENSIPGEPFQSPLIRAVAPTSLGGFGDQKTTPEFHPGGTLFEPGEPALEKLTEWIKNAALGPGIPVGNPGSHPKDIALSRDQKHIYVGNTGTMDISIIDVEAEQEVGGIYIQNVANHLAIIPDSSGKRDMLIALTMGAGFGAPKGRDPWGGETWDPNHPAAQFSVLRDPETTDSYALEQQSVLGPFDAVDGTWNFKMRDIQNDIVAVDLSLLPIPSWQQDMRLNYLLKANSYESHPQWTRYTSDTAEATTGDIKGDIPPELQRVHGAFPEWMATEGDRIFVTMSGTFEVVEWKVQHHPGNSLSDPSEKLAPVRVFETGLRPMGIAIGKPGTPSEGKLFVANRLGESLSIIDRKTGQSREITVGNLSRPPLDTDAEKGELIVHSSVFSSDGDTSCLHCHYRDTGDGRGWGAAETIGQNRSGHFTPGGTLGIPQMRNVFAIQPYYFEGTHVIGEGQGADINEPASSIDFDRPVWTGDFSQLQSPVPKSERRLMHEELKERVEVRKLGPVWYDLEERRDEFLRRQSLRYFGEAYALSDFYRFVGAWLGNTNHLLPNPYDKKDPSVIRGSRLFNDVQVMCGVCHRAPEFTNKSLELAPNDRRALPSLTTITQRDASYTLVSVHALEKVNGREFDFSPEDPGRVEDKEGSFTTMQLRGIFDRPPIFLHHGRARSLREVLCTPQHPALSRYRYPVLQGSEEVRPGRKEMGLNEITLRSPEGKLKPMDQIFDTHGGTSHLTKRQIEDLLNFMLSIE